MNHDELRRLRIRLTATFAVVLLVVLALLAGIAIHAESGNRYDALDREVERVALAADGYAYPGGTRAS